MTRRTFLQSSSILAAITLAAPPFTVQRPAERAFKICLNPGNIGVAANQKSLLDMAIAHGYEAIVAFPEELSTFSEGDMSAFLDDMESNTVSWGSSNLPVDFRKDEATFRQGLEVLPVHAQALERAGATRMNTWIMPSHDELTYRENFARHASRLGACADILADHGVRLGLEYVGPKTLMNRSRYPFMRTMAEARELIAEMGRPNVGLVLDSFHWYCAEDTYEDIAALTNDDIVTVDLNDARADLSRDEQIDGTRHLPGATGVIDLNTFMEALVAVGYDGPVRAEPFNQELRDMDDEAALTTTYEAMKKTVDLSN